MGGRAIPGRHELLNNHFSARHGIPPSEFLVREATEVSKTIAIAFGYPP